MKIMTTLVGAADAGHIYSFDTIEHAGGLWLVSKWLENPAEGYKTPARLIRFDHLRFQKTSFGGADFMLNEPVPTPVLDGQQTEGYEVIDGPDIRFPIPAGVH